MLLRAQAVLCATHTKQCAVVVAVACCAVVAPQMKACADKDLRVVTEGHKKPAMAKFQHLQHVSSRRLRLQLLKQRSSTPLARGGRAGPHAACVDTLALGCVCEHVVCLGKHNMHA